MLRRLLPFALPALLLLTRGPALAAAGAEYAATVSLVPALEGLSEAPVLPPCGQGSGLPAVTYWQGLADAGGPGRADTALLKRGWTAWLLGECADAEVAWAEACAGGEPPSVAPGCLWLFLSSQGRFGEVPRARGSLQEMARFAYLYGFWTERSEQVEDEGQEFFAHALSLDLAPNREAAERLARLHLQVDRPEDAAAVWEALASAFATRDPDHWWGVARAAELKDDWHGAAEAYGGGARVAEEPYAYWMAQGNAWRRAEEWAAAEESYRGAAAARPDASAPYLELGHLRRRREDYAGARSFYTEAATVHPDRVGPWHYVGLAYYQEGDMPQALAAFDRALTIDPDHANTTYHLAQTLHQMGEPKGAAETLARAIDLHGREPWRWALQLGDWRRDLGVLEGALEAYNQALEWRPGDESIEKRIEEVTDSEG